jgi:hypothetical protein
VLKFDDASNASQRLHEWLYAKYQSNIVPPTIEGQIFRPIAKDITYVGSDYLLAEGVREDLISVHAKLRELIAR